jgi:hypothetical protein
VGEIIHFHFSGSLGPQHLHHMLHEVMCAAKVKTKDIRSTTPMAIGIPLKIDLKLVTHD